MIGGEELTQPFVWNVRVYHEDTDMGGVVYYANYLKFAERARTEWLRALGFEQAELARTHAVLFVVRSASIEYFKPSRLDDALQVTVELVKVGASQIDVNQRVLRGDDPLAYLEIRIACVAAGTMRPVRMPAPLAARIRM